MMKGMFCSFSLLLLLSFTSLTVLAWDVNHQNVVWNTPSESSFGSMPLGNGDIGMNVWVEPNGDVLFYISKVNAFDSKHYLPKLGRIRMRFEPALSFDSFEQVLSLSDATIHVKTKDLNLEICVAANQPLIHLKGSSSIPRIIKYYVEPLRPLNKGIQNEMKEGTVGLLLPSSDNQLLWAYENRSSDWYNNLMNQNTDSLIQVVKDPIYGRISGCNLTGKRLKKTTDYSLESTGKQTDWQDYIVVESSQPGSIEKFIQEINKPILFDRKAHLKYWKDFWDRSYIDVHSCGEGLVHLDQCRYTQIPQGALAYEGHKTIEAQKNACQITQRYALERFCEAIASRGEVPPPYNGSIFTMDMPAGVLGFDKTKDEPVSPDNRDWAILSFMWQNTRHPYWSMATRGDYDCMINCFEFIKDGLEICKDHCKKIFGHAGAFIMEASWWYNVGVFNWDQTPSHLKYHQLATIELPSIMCQYYEYTRDKSFLDTVLLPCADEFIKYYQLHYPQKDAYGNFIMEGVGCAETYQGVTNPCTEIGCLKFLLDKLLSFDIEDSYRERWEAFRNILPDVPYRTIRGKKLLAVGDRYDPGRTNCESPELYSVYPFRQVWLGKPERLNIARQSFHVKTVSLDGTDDSQGVETGGWQSSPVQAAYLGLSREAARLVSINFNDQFVHWNDNIPIGTPYPNRPRARFPAFWECKMDGTPDNDHGANSVNALQSMLLQSDGDKIYLLPAWPEDWDVSFKLKAANNTTVSCEYRDGTIKKLQVSPKSREKDIVNMSSCENRIRTMVETAMSDYNYLYFLPPMLDAQPIPGPVTASWISQYGYTIEGCKAGPWPNALFKENTVYIHIFDKEQTEYKLPPINRKLLFVESIRGKFGARQQKDGILLSGVPDATHTILKLTFDGTIEPIIDDMIHQGALFDFKELTETNLSDQRKGYEVTFAEPVQFERFEFLIDNFDHLRGEGIPFSLEILSTDNQWEKVYEGAVFGLICGKKINSVKTRGVRLVLPEKEKVTDFSVYPE